MYSHSYETAGRCVLLSPSTCKISSAMGNIECSRHPPVSWVTDKHRNVIVISYLGDSVRIQKNSVDRVYCYHQIREVLFFVGVDGVQYKSIEMLKRN